MCRIRFNVVHNAPCSAGEIEELTSPRKERRKIPVNHDWDYPKVASSFGWSIREVQTAKRDGDFDWTAQCGILVCTQCNLAHYPMEVEGNECPDCGGTCQPFEPCDHRGTDGTVDCPCGVTAGEFIAAAYTWLRGHDGETADDPGYFAE